MLVELRTQNRRAGSPRRPMIIILMLILASRPFTCLAHALLLLFQLQMASNSSEGQLSEADAQLLKIYGVVTMQEVLGILFEGVFFGVYTIFFSLAVYSIRQKGLKSRRSIVMSAVVGYLFTTSATAWGVDCYITFQNMHDFFMTPGIPLLDRADLADDTFDKFVGVQELFFVFNAIVADAVVIWRTWAVYLGWIPAIIAPCFLLLAAFIFALIDVTISLYNRPTPLPGATTIYTKSQILVWALSLAINVLCTVLIGFKAWRHRKVMKELNPGIRYHGMTTENILSLLIESGFIYSFLWAAQIIGYLDFSPDSPWNYISQVVVRIGRQITGLYPTLIIVIVNFRRTIWEEYPETPRISSSGLRWARSAKSRTETRTSDSRLETSGDANEGRVDSDGMHYRRDKANSFADEGFRLRDRVVVP